MNREQMFQACFDEAVGIVAAYRASIPEGVEFYNGSGGGSSGSSKMERYGTTVNARSTVLPSFLSNIITEQVNNAAVPAHLTNASDNLLAGLLTRDNTKVQGQSMLDTALNDLDPNQFAGRESLTAMANVNPETSTFEADTLARYQDRVGQALAQVSSGPDVVRGGTARNAITQGVTANEMALNRGQEVRAAKQQDGQMAMVASQILNTIEQGRRAALLTGQNQLMQQYLAGVGQSMGANQVVNERSNAAGQIYSLATRALGSEVGATSENLKGQGAQSSSNWNAGVSCCFIFMEAFNGDLPWFVRRARDIFYDECPARGQGYTKMAKWLVPWMRKSKLVRSLVNLFMIQPLTKYGAWMFNHEESRSRFRLYKPVVYGWFKFWQFYGKV